MPHRVLSEPGSPSKPRNLQLAIPQSGIVEGTEVEWIVRPRSRTLVRIRVCSSPPLEVRDPAGLEVGYSHYDFEADSVEVEFVAASPGPWRLVLRSESSDRKTYRVEWFESRPAIATDEARWQSIVARHSMRQCIGRGDAPRAVRAAGEAADARQRGDHDSLAAARFIENLGLEFVLADIDSLRPHGAPLLLRALDLRKQAAGERSLVVADAENTLSTFYYILGRFDEAAAWQRQSVDVLESRTDVSDSLLAFNQRDLGLIHYHLGDYEKAKGLFAQALTVFDSGPAEDAFLAADLHNNIGSILRIERRGADSHRHFDRAIQLADSLLQSASDPELHAGYERALRNMQLNAAGLLFDDSRYDEAEVLYRKVMELPEESDTPPAMVLPTAYMNVAIICRIQGRYEEAEALFRKALDLGRKKLGSDHPNTFAYMDHLAELLVEEQRFAAAEEVYRECVGLLDRSGAAGASRLWSPLRGFANLMRLQARPAEAESLYRRCIANQEQFFGDDAPELARTRIGLARVLLDKNPPELEPASRLVETALATLESSRTLPEVRVAANVLAAEILYRQGKVRSARDRLLSALDEAETLRRFSSVDDRGRAAFFADYSQAFDEVIAWSLELEDLPSAVRSMERFRARVLLEQMQVAGVDLMEGLPADVRADLERRESEANLQIARAERGLELAEKMAASSANPSRSVESLQRERDTAVENLRLVQAEIRRKSPTWSRTMSAGGEVVGLEQIRDQLLGPDEALLLDHVGKQRSFVIWIPKRGAPRGFELALAPSDARALGVEPGAVTSTKLAHAILGTSATPTGGSRGVAPVVESRARNGATPSVLEILETPHDRLAETEIDALHALWNGLVPQALRSEIRKQKRLVIIPDGVLHRLPYEALVLEPRQKSGDPVFWLEAGPIVRYAPSATVLATQQRMKGRHPGSNHGILTVSDPAFEARTPAGEAPAELASQPAGDPIEMAQGATRQRAERMGLLEPLPGTALESRAILDAFGSKTVQVLQGQQARESAVRTALAGKQYVHLATHGIVENRMDDLYAAIALTPGSSETPDRADDGFLELSEIYGLRLDADLVVLSACSTHEGSWIEGDGVFALTRGFLSAGCPRVVGSLWRVDDTSTADLIAHFFDSIAASERAKKRPDFARGLRDARLRLRNSSNWKHPYYWAPFVLLGLQ